MTFQQAARGAMMRAVLGLLLAMLWPGADAAYAQWLDGKPREKIRFLVGADPQFEFYSWDVRFTRTEPTMHFMVDFLVKCRDCTKVADRG